MVNKMNTNDLPMQILLSNSLACIMMVADIRQIDKSSFYVRWWNEIENNAMVFNIQTIDRFFCSLLIVIQIVLWILSDIKLYDLCSYIFNSGRSFRFSFSFWFAIFLSLSLTFCVCVRNVIVKNVQNPHKRTFW